MSITAPAARLAALREELLGRELDGFVVPISDEHMSEYVGDYAQRLAWLTGFGGSAGSAVVLTRKGEGPGAAIFTDGRYTVQVREQVDGALFEYQPVPETSPAGWIADHAAPGARIGYDVWLHGIGWSESAAAVLAAKDIALVPLSDNPIDAVWANRPAPSIAPAMPYADAAAGRNSADKRAMLGDWLRAEGCDAVVISALDSIAWLLNIRGSDVANTPVTLSYVTVRADGTAELFIAPEKLTPALTQHLGNAVRVRPRAAFADALAELAGQRVAIDPDRAVAGIFHALERAGAVLMRRPDPTVAAKAVKNQAERQGHREAQARDGAAMVRFLRWIGENAPGGTIDELTAAAKLRAFRGLDPALVDVSFDTISAAGPHAALPHYKVDAASNIPIPPSSIYLCDSGGQYVGDFGGGTTDITRTVWIGPGDPMPEMIERNTRVLKGHIALACARFPAGTTGGQLDALARLPLWAAGMDYGHGTGHGVGSFLAVHEGPQRIAKPGGAYAGTDTPLVAGMILSNEPGYYRQGHYGIRIENLILVVPAAIDGAEGEYLGFETLTFAPLDRRLVDKRLLSPAEIAWWNAYHAEVRKVLAPRLDGADLAWLETETEPL